MEQPDVAVKEVVDIQLKLPGKYHVIMHNDDVTAMNFVVEVLCEVFGMETKKAVKVMLRIHHQGSAIVGTYVKSIAEVKVQLCDKLASEAGYPLRVSMEKE